MGEKQGDNSTKYGEFVCSEYHWLTSKKQKEKAKKLETITNIENKRKKEKN